MARTRTAAAARRPATAAARGTAARRVSGPIRPGHPRPVRAVPASARVPAAAVAVPATGAGARLRALPDHRLLDTLLRSRAWIWLLGIGLGGIVAMQVSLLKMNAGIGTAVQASAELEHQNAALQEQVAELSSGDRISSAAGALGLVMPGAGAVDYLDSRPGVDARRAAENMTAPTDAARQLLADGGRTTVASSATTTAPTTTSTSTTTTPTNTTTTPTTTSTTPAETTTAPSTTVAPPPAATQTPSTATGGTLTQQQASAAPAQTSGGATAPGQ
jgi:cell division protein FtsB